MASDRQTTAKRPMALYLCGEDGHPIVTLPLTAEQYAAIAKEEARDLPPQGFELSISAFVMPEHSNGR